MRAVHVGIGHDDDFVIAQFVEIKRAFTLAVANARADGRDHRADFVVLKNFVEPRFLDVDQFAANRQNRLELPVAALLGRAAGGITFDNVKLRVRRIAVGTIRQFARQSAAGQRRFADGFARFARRFAGARGVQDLCQ